MSTATSLNPDLPPVLRAWLEQLLSPDLIALIGSTSIANSSIDVRLSANRGRVRRQPVITLNGGTSDMDFLPAT